MRTIHCFLLVRRILRKDKSWAVKAQLIARGTSTMLYQTSHQEEAKVRERTDKYLKRNPYLVLDKGLNEVGS